MLTNTHENTEKILSKLEKISLDQWNFINPNGRKDDYYRDCVKFTSNFENFFVEFYYNVRDMFPNESPTEVKIYEKKEGNTNQLIYSFKGNLNIVGQSQYHERLEGIYKNILEYLKRTDQSKIESFAK